jgi:thiol-disulfide isomerase/thioredoxin
MANFIKHTMRFIRLFIFFTLIVGSISVWGQTQENIPVVNFKQFEPLLHKSNDTVYVINFWATWCVPCRKELPEFEKLYKSSQDKNISILLVSLDFPKHVESGLKPFLKKNNITAPVLLLNDPNSNAWINKVDKKWSGSLPATLLYKGQSRLFFEKELDFESLIHAIDQINN